jgi:hypothetical protein
MPSVLYHFSWRRHHAERGAPDKEEVVIHSRTRAGLVAGGIAIIANMLALQAADAISLATAHGGLLRFIRPWFEPPLRALGLSDLWSSIGGPPADAPIFQSGFHLVVGLVMALAYAFVLERALPGRAWAKGLIYAAFIWLLNAAIVLPETGEGFAGSAHLTMAGMTWFAAAHTLFFLLLAVTYSRLR